MLGREARAQVAGGTTLDVAGGMNSLPIVSTCEETGCFFNRELGCHAPAINVGAEHPRCDTYAPSSSHIGRPGGGFVGACHVAECTWNEELTCSAPSIQVGHHQDHPDCMTFDPRT
jgi:hypothetical protein